MKTVIRFDQGSLRKPERTPQGFLKVDGLAARIGVLEYPNTDGTIRRELRLPEDVFRADSLAAYEGISVTDGHPTVLVDTSNARTLEAGTVTGVARRDGDWVVTPIVVKDQKLIAKIEAGDTGLSVGYRIRLDETPGTHPVYGRYDAIQRGIEPNHLAAAVRVPRAGGDARIRMDDALYECTDSQIDRSGTGSETGLNREGTAMDKDEQIRLLQTQLAESKTKAAQFEADLKTRTDECDTAKNELAAAKQIADDAKVRLDSGLAVAETEAVKKVTGQLDEANAKIRELEGSIPVLVRKRASLVTRAQAVLGDDYRADALDDRVILEAGIRRFEPKAELAKESVLGLQARFDAYYEARAVNATSLRRASADMAIVQRADNKEIDPFDPLQNGAGQYSSPHAAKRGA